jgi:hypothetical protein
MAAPAITADRPARRQSIRSRLHGGDTVAHLVTWIFACSVLLVTIMLVWQLWSTSGLTRHKFGFHFLTGTNWDPVAGDFGALPFIYGTVSHRVLALIISVPLGVGAAIFLAELAPAAFRYLYVSGGTAGRDSQRHLRLAGDFHPSPVDAGLRRTVSEVNAGVSAAVSGSGVRFRAT